MADNGYRPRRLSSIGRAPVERSAVAIWKTKSQPPRPHGPIPRSLNTLPSPRQRKLHLKAMIQTLGGENASPVPDTYAIEIGPICKALDELLERAKGLERKLYKTKVTLNATERSLELHLNVHTTMDELLGLASRSREEVVAAKRADIAELKTKAADIRRELRSIRAQKGLLLKRADQIAEAHREPLSKYLP